MVEGTTCKTMSIHFRLRKTSSCSPTTGDFFISMSVFRGFSPHVQGSAEYAPQNCDLKNSYLIKGILNNNIMEKASIAETGHTINGFV